MQQLASTKMIFSVDGTHGELSNTSSARTVLNLVDPMSSASTLLADGLSIARLQGDAQICLPCPLSDGLRKVGGVEVVLRWLHDVSTVQSVNIFLSLLATVLKENPCNSSSMLKHRGYHVVTLLLTMKASLVDEATVDILIQASSCEGEKHARKSVSEAHSIITKPSSEVPDETIVVSNVHMIKVVLLDWNLWSMVSSTLQVKILRYFQRLVGANRFRRHNIAGLRKVGFFPRVLLFLRRLDLDEAVTEEVVAVIGAYFQNANNHNYADLDCLADFILTTFTPGAPEDAINQRSNGTGQAMHNGEGLNEPLTASVKIRNMLLKMLLDVQMTIAGYEPLDRWFSALASKLVTFLLERGVNPTTVLLVMEMLGLCLIQSWDFVQRFQSIDGFQSLAYVLSTFYGEPELYYLLFRLLFEKSVLPRLPEVQLANFYELLRWENEESLRFPELLQSICYMLKAAFDKLDPKELTSSSSSSSSRKQGEQTGILRSSSTGESVTTRGTGTADSSSLEAGAAKDSSEAAMSIAGPTKFLVASLVQFLEDLAKKSKAFRTACIRQNLLETFVDLYFSCARSAAAAQLSDDFDVLMEEKPPASILVEPVAAPGEAKAEAVVEAVAEAEAPKPQQSFPSQEELLQLVADSGNDELSAADRSLRASLIKELLVNYEMEGSSSQDAMFGLCSSPLGGFSERSAGIASSTTAASIALSPLGMSSTTAMANASAIGVQKHKVELTPAALQSMKDFREKGGMAAAAADSVMELIAEVLADAIVDQPQGFNILQTLLKMTSSVSYETFTAFQGFCLLRLLSCVDRRFMKDRDGAHEQRLEKVKWAPNLEALSNALVDRVHLNVFLTSADVLAVLRFHVSMVLLCGIENLKGVYVEPHLQALLRNCNRLVMYFYLPENMRVTETPDQTSGKDYSKEALAVFLENASVYSNALHVDPPLERTSTSHELLSCLLHHSTKMDALGREAVRALALEAWKGGNVITHKSSKHWEEYVATVVKRQEVEGENKSSWQTEQTKRQSEQQSTLIQHLQKSNKQQDVRVTICSARISELRSLEQENYGSMLEAERFWRARRKRTAAHLLMSGAAHSKSDGSWTLSNMEGRFRMRRVMARKLEEEPSVLPKTNPNTAAGDALDLELDNSEDTGEYLIKPHLADGDAMKFSYNCALLQHMKVQHGILVVGDKFIYFVEEVSVNPSGNFRRIKPEQIPVLERDLGLVSDPQALLQSWSKQSGLQEKDTAGDDDDESGTFGPCTCDTFEVVKEWRKSWNPSKSSASRPEYFSESPFSQMCRCWKVKDVVGIQQRTHRFQPTGVEIFFRKYGTVFFLLKSNDRPELLQILQTQWGVKTDLKQMTSSAQEQWEKGEITNFAYLMHLNTLAGRSYHDLSQYPVFPWVISDYESESLDLNDQDTFRRLDKPMGALSLPRKKLCIERFKNWSDRSTTPSHHTSHYSSVAIVLTYLARMPPFTQSVADYKGEYTFSSVEGAWRSASEGSSSNTSDVRELIPEFFYQADFLEDKYTSSSFKSVELPPWAHSSARVFVQMHRQALESTYVSDHLNDWIDLIFGYKQQGQHAIDAVNVFPQSFHSPGLAMYGANMANGPEGVEAQMYNEGYVPHQIFTSPHPRRRRVQFEQTFEAWLPKLGKFVPQEVRTLSSSVNQVFLANDKLIVAGSHRILRPPEFHHYVAWGWPDCTLRLFQSKDNRLLVTFEALHDDGPIRCAAVSEDGSMVITGGEDGIAAVWAMHDDRISGKVQLEPLEKLSVHSDTVTCISVCQSYNRIFTGSIDRTVAFWDLQTFSLIHHLSTFSAPITCLTCDLLTGDLVVGAGTMLTLCNVNGGRLIEQDMAVKGDTRDMAILSTCVPEHKELTMTPIILTSHKCGALKVWTTMDSFQIQAQSQSSCGEPRFGLVCELSWKDPISALYATPNMKFIFSGDQSGQVCCWSDPENVYDATSYKYDP